MTEGFNAINVPFIQSHSAAWRSEDSQIQPASSYQAQGDLYSALNAFPPLSPHSLSRSAMASSEETPLSELAANIATAAREEAAIAEQILEESKGDNPKIESVLSNSRCIADASDFLSNQLSALGEKDELALRSEDDEFWKLLRTLMELWLHNAKRTVEKMKKDDARQDSLTGRVAQHFRVKFEADVANVHGPLTWSGATLQDMQMVVAMLNLYETPTL